LPVDLGSKVGKRKQDKNRKKAEKGFKKEQKNALKEWFHGCKTKCCDKYKKADPRGAVVCPCFV